jgi:hypothetical protein
MELWSLMHFLMPDVFASHSQFRDWFCNPLTGMVEGSEAYNKVGGSVREPGWLEGCRAASVQHGALHGTHLLDARPELLFTSIPMSWCIAT